MKNEHVNGFCALHDMGSGKKCNEKNIRRSYRKMYDNFEQCHKILWQGQKGERNGSVRDREKDSKVELNMNKLCNSHELKWNIALIIKSCESTCSLCTNT